MKKDKIKPNGFTIINDDQLNNLLGGVDTLKLCATYELKCSTSVTMKSCAALDIKCLGTFKAVEV